MTSGNSVARCWSAVGKRAIAARNPSSDTSQIQAFQHIIPRPWVTTIARSWDYGNWSRKDIHKTFTIMWTVAEDDVLEGANMTTEICVEFQVCRSHAETDSTSWSIPDTASIVHGLEREIYSITLTKQMRFKKVFSICIINCEAKWQAIGIHELRKTIEQCIIPFGYPKIQLVSHMSHSIQRMVLGDNFTTDISEQLHISNVKEAYRSNNKVIDIWLMLKHNHWSTGLDNMEEILSFLALQGWYDIDLARALNLQSAANILWNTRWTCLLPTQHCQECSIFRAVSHQVHHLRETLVHGVCRSIKVTSLGNASEDFIIPNYECLFCQQIEEDGGLKVSGLVPGYDHNVLLDSIFIQLQNGLLYYYQPFHCPTSVEHLGLDWKVEYANANQGIMPECQNICVQYTESEDNDLDNTVQCWVLSFPV